MSHLPATLQDTASWQDRAADHAAKAAALAETRGGMAGRTLLLLVYGICLPHLALRRLYSLRLGRQVAARRNPGATAR